MLARIKSTLGYAVAAGLRADNPADAPALKALLPKRPKNGTKHRDSIPHEAVGEALAKVDADDATGERTKQLIRFLALTAVREGEAREADWSEFDLEAKVWTIPSDRMKRRREFQVPLSDQACEVLRERSPGLGLLRGGRVWGNLSDGTLRKVFKRLRLGGVPHGLRTSFRTWAADTGVPSEVGEACLSHAKGSQTEQAYQRSAMLERRRPVMQAWADYVSE